MYVYMNQSQTYRGSINNWFKMQRQFCSVLVC